MILSKEFYDQCCPTYQKVIDELEEKLAELEAQGEEEMNQDEMNENFQQIKAVILKFAEKYLTPKEYWDYCIAQADDLDLDENEKQCYEINAIAYQHFYYDEELDMLSNPEGGGELHLTLMDFQSKYYVDEGGYTAKERDISFPHNCLKECFRYIESNASRLPSTKVYKRYKEMKEMYSKIKAAEEDVEEWFNLLIEVDNSYFVKDNVEYRLGKNLLDVKLWMLYIEFLKQKEKYEDLLQVYSKYCRFFLDDFDMFEKYKSEMVEHGPADLFWNYAFDFEQNENDEDMQSDEDKFMVEDESKDETMEEDDEESNIKVLPLNKQLCSTFYKTFKVQDFSLPKPLILYILENANHRILRNLFKSCKYFFFKKPTPICYCLESGSAAKFNEENLILTFSGDDEKFIKNTYITTRIDIRMYFFLNPLNTVISSLIPLFSRCDAKYIYLVGQNLSFNDFKFLVSHGQVVHYHLTDGEIKDETNAYVDLEKIMKYFGNIEELLLPAVKVNADTAHALSNQNFNRKISFFYIASIFGEPFDPDELLKFCVKTRDEKIFFRMTFNKEFNAAFVQNLKQIMSDYKESLENTEICIFLND
uniref:Uncharacterized protein n=1 Tax=Panagrolaimus davidi TaxID=227884 RepID=A0A914PRX1_9BILA